MPDTVPKPPLLYQVALDTPLDTLFDYLPPSGQAADPAWRGRRVLAPFGRRTLVGVIVGCTDSSAQPAESLKPLAGIDALTPALPEELLRLATFAATYYQHPLGPVLASLLPPALRRVKPEKPRAPWGYRLSAVGREALSAAPPPGRVQRELFARLAQGALAYAAENPRARAWLRAWHENAWVEVIDRAPAGAARADAALSEGPTLTEEQRTALGAMAAEPGYVCWLLHGVTGSGKTEVYLQRIAAMLRENRQTLILAPEIHLIPQLEERIAARFPAARRAVLHSGLAAGPRRQAWLDALRGEADIVIGTRLAAFAPLRRPGLIIVDEEHDPAYKQLDGMRYSARDLAVWRARQNGVPVILGSATPALESWHNANTGRYRRLALTLRARASAALPRVSLIHTRAERTKNGLSEPLIQALTQRLQRGEQSLVFINRRGYAPAMQCGACGHIFNCERCSAHRVLHRHGQGYRLVCHHCGLSTLPPVACPECGNIDLRPSGHGTQRIEATLAELFPEARLLRIDRDTASRRGAFAEMRAQIETRAVDILIGTQILAKGHDFPHLSLVGVVGADRSLASPDFRAGERLFAQLMQVAGRAGRAEHPGEVLLQTDYPQHPLYQALQAHDYVRFARQTLRDRQGAGFPPFVSQCVLRAEARDPEALSAFLQSAREAGLTLGGVCLYDPVPALLERVAHKHRQQLLVQARNRAALQAFLPAWKNAILALPGKGVHWVMDVDPQEA